VSLDDIDDNNEEAVMVAVSERAKRILFEQKRAANIDGADVGLRVAAAPSGQWMLLVDEPREGDQVVEHDGTTVLLVDPVAQTALVGAEVDCVETPEGDVELVLSRAYQDNGLEDDELDEEEEGRR
jgi:Fe-S cluster assembly iron-binding protein IscA